MGVVDRRPRFSNRADLVPRGRAHRGPARSAVLQASKVELAFGIFREGARFFYPLTEGRRGYAAACNRHLRSKVPAAVRSFERFSIGYPTPRGRNAAQRTG